ncbi:hypothetical protein OIDMADRAFT_144524 [Oidiodendron maius Zn]|uniref:Uncharacterized protein n=1 Tax=Oidiodendron maius (strain Zn) TaxID=913774 RepID=A0A0C3HFF9_OIDMZ|nr:hypothetical protein OIDMADRAFT_144524 [Oidiodendron maius Zn]
MQEGPHKTRRGDGAGNTQGGRRRGKQEGHFARLSRRSSCLCMFAESCTSSNWSCSDQRGLSVFLPILTPSPPACRFSVGAGGGEWCTSDGVKDLVAARKKGNPTHPHPPSHPDPISPPSAGNNHYPKRSRRTHYELDLPTGEGTAALQREHPAPYRRVVIGRSNQCWDIRSIRSTVACSLPYRRYKTGSKTRPKGKRKKEEDEEEEEGEKTKKNHYNKNKNGPL